MEITIIKNWSLKKVIWTKYFEVLDNYIFELLFYWETYTINIPVWFITDFWSIPNIFFNFDKTKYISYIMHDYLYSLIWKITKEKWVELVYTRRMADDMLEYWLKHEWMIYPWRKLVSLWLFIWWRFCYKKRDLKLSIIKTKIKTHKNKSLIY